MMNKIKNILSLLPSPIIKNARFFFLMYMLGGVCIVFEPWNGSRFWSFFELYLDLYIVCSLLALLPKRVASVCCWMCAVLLYVVAVVDMILYVRIGAPIVPILLQMALQSNIQESSEAVSSYINWSILWSPLLLIFIIIGLHLLTYIYARLIAKRLSGLIALVERHRPLLGLVVGVLVMICVKTSFVNKQYLYYRTLCQMKEIEVQTMDDITPNTRYYIPIYRLVWACSENYMMSAVTKELRHRIDDDVIDSCSFTSPNIVVIIGESYNRSHSHLYGYEKFTTPLQDSLLSTGRMAVFENVISSWNATCESFQNMFSCYTVGDSLQWYEQPFVTVLMRKAGYDVFFLSNQFVMDPSSTYSSFVEDIFMNDNELSQAQFSWRNTVIHPYDEGLLSDYSELQCWQKEQTEVRKDSLRPTMTIFHFMGMHADFKERYPKAWMRFTAADYERPDLTVEDKQILADYDNAILYNDYVADSIVKLFEDQEAIILFLADHGERVYDDCTVFGRNLTWNAVDVKPQFTIPFWIYVTPRYAEHHPTLWKDIERAKNKPYMTDALAHTLLYLGGVSTKCYRKERNVLCGDYEISRKRIIREERDFDLLMSGK